MKLKGILCVHWHHKETESDIRKIKQRLFQLDTVYILLSFTVGFNLLLMNYILVPTTSTTTTTTTTTTYSTLSTKTYIAYIS